MSSDFHDHNLNQTPGHKSRDLDAVLGRIDAPEAFEPLPSGPSMADVPSPLSEAEDPIDAIGSTDIFQVTDDPEPEPLETLVSSPAATGPWNQSEGQDMGNTASHARKKSTGRPRGGGKKRRPWLVPAIIVGAAAAVYAGGAFAFSRVFFPNTTVDGIDVSLKGTADLAASIDDETSGYSLKLSGDGVDVSIAAADIDLRYDGEALAAAALGQLNPLAWPYELTQSRAISLEKTLTYDEDALAAVLTPLVEESTAAADEAAREAAIVYDADQRSFVLQGAGDTRHLEGDKLTAKVEEALDSLTPTLELGDDVMSDGGDFTQALAAANAYVTAAPSLMLAGADAGAVTADQIASWLTFGDDLSVELDESKITSWCQGDLSSKLDTVGSSRTYTRADGKSVTVKGGSYGWNINGAELASDIADALRSGEATTIDIPTKSAAAVYAGEGKKDWGNRFIDIDLTEQHVRMYDDSGSLVWESDCVTGDTTQGHDTPEGVYQLDDYRAQGDVELKGAVDPATGEPEYISHVDYWMPFIGNSYALHDADWRSRFGGTIYQGNGSHGCVNLPVSKAAELYNLTKVGDVVVVHF